MHSFKDFGIKASEQKFTGEKIKLERILNREITIHEFKIGPSNFDGKRLDMQISVGTEKRVFWTASGVLMDMIEKVPPEGFPFITTIVKDNDRLVFT